MKLTHLLLITVCMLLGSGLLRAADPPPPAPAPKPVFYFVDLSTLQVRRFEIDEGEKLTLMQVMLLMGVASISAPPQIHLWRGQQHLRLLHTTERKFMNGTLKEPEIKSNDVVMVGPLSPAACKRLLALPEIVDALKHPAKEPIPLSKEEARPDEPVEPFSF